MFAGTLTKNADTATAVFTGTIHNTKFDIAIQLETRAKMSERSPDYDVTAVNKSGRKLWHDGIDENARKYAEALKRPEREHVPLRPGNIV